MRVKQGLASALIGGLVAVTLAAPAMSQDATVQLQAKDGSFDVTGELVLYESGVFLVEVEGTGLLKIESSQVNCIGSACPDGGSAVVRKRAPAATAAAVTPSAPTFGTQFGIHGSRTVGTTLIPNLLRGYAKAIDADFAIEATDDPAARIVRLTNADGTVRAEIDLQTRGSGSAFKSLAADAAEIGLADRRMKDSDLEKLAAVGVPELRDTANETILGVDGIVLITHKDNPVPNLTSAEVARIWSGEITNWQELGGGDHPITVNSFGEGSGDRAVLLEGLVRPNGRDEKPDVVRWNAYQDMVDAVMADRGGIGFVGRWLARTNDVNLLSIREACGLLSPPTDFRMKIEGYTLSRRLYAYTRPGEMHPEAKAFLDWTLTDAAQPYIKQSHFIDRGLERMRLEDMGMMLIHTAAVEPDFDGNQYKAMMRELRNTDRLSMSFRFRTASSELDVESVRVLQEFAQLVESGEFDGLEVLLVGFADAIGDRVRNTELAQSRANAVRRVLATELSPAARLRVPLVPLSYGELLPLSCNGDEVGRARNRRVEVWLRRPGSRTSLR